MTGSCSQSRMDVWGVLDPGREAGSFLDENDCSRSTHCRLAVMRTPTRFQSDAGHESRGFELGRRRIAEDGVWIYC